MLLAGTPAAEAAILAGFCDQAHLIRQFRRHYARCIGPQLKGKSHPIHGQPVVRKALPKKDRFRMSFKPAIIIAVDLPFGLKSNFAAVLGMSLGQLRPELVGPATPTQEGVKLCGITSVALPILGAEELPVRLAYMRAAFETRDYSDYMVRIAAAPLVEHEPQAILLGGPRKMVDRICGRIPLLC